jgi:hypothetical protein
MSYAVIVAGAVSRYPANPRSDHPTVSIPLAWAGGTIGADTYVTVATTAQPVFDSSQNYLVEGTPVNNAGTWTQVWVVTPLDSTTATNRQNINAMLNNAAANLSSINTYLGLAVPSAAQQTAAIKTLMQICQLLIQALQATLTKFT